MRTLRTVTELRTALTAPRARDARVGLVPTMGAFHDGHRSLMRRARQDCDLVVVSLFVNPAQFDSDHDLASYPREVERDQQVAEAEQVDLLFAPTVDQIYPAGFATSVHVAGVSAEFEGAARGVGHFDAVATVVSKLFTLTTPQVAYFGQKDAQQVQVLKRLITDLNFPVQLAVCPIVREPDGLAMSSRNARLTRSGRAQAVALHRALARAQACVAAGETDVDVVLSAARAELDTSHVRSGYMAVVEPETFTKLTVINAPALALVAAGVEGVRLIDNCTLDPSTTTLPPPNAAQPSRQLSTVTGGGKRKEE